jgi:hypothetical protein
MAMQVFLPGYDLRERGAERIAIWRAKLVAESRFARAARISCCGPRAARARMRHVLSPRAARTVEDAFAAAHTEPDAAALPF